MGGPDFRGLDALLRKHQLDITSEEVLDQLDSTFATIPAAGAAPLSMAEVQFLHAHDDTGVAAVIDNWSGEQLRQAQARSAARALADTLSGSMSIKEAATLLEIDRSGVSRRIAGKRLWAFAINGSRRIPRWQFLGSKLLPGLNVIVSAIPRDTTPASMEAFMKTPQPDFGDHTPIEHLAAGGDPNLIADFVSDLGRW
ncbi:helix-turn-helix domain-containing protein [Mycobacterium paraffinicum]|uniref:DNA-binding protein n=1 Tax=Mycobacterium paraffinicum TaxID=53378 RepID=A0A1Q4H7Q2_9MYCO|nr:helix-turn-helix domain-containing protein [Mycobacterium paraffinicum]OJZ63580.1 DNA-binding protein [Mycobacterium paraffinicum]